MNTVPRDLNVALIGHGYVGRTFHAPLIRSVPGLKLALIASSDAAAVQAAWPGVPVETDYLAAAQAPGIDLVVIATPNHSHHPLARSALLAGRAVVIDKPFTVTLDEAQDLVDLAHERGQLLSVFHNRRWDGDFLTLAQHIRSGALGEVREFVSRFDRFDPTPRDRWRERPGPGSGLWYDLGPHLVDQALCLFGAPDRVSADLACLRDGSDTVDYAQVTLLYEQPRRRITLHCTRLAALTGARFEAHSQLGSLSCHGLDTQEDQLKAGMTPGGAGWGEDTRPITWMDWRDAAQGANTRVERAATALPRLAGDYRHYYAGIRDALHGVGPNPVPAEQALLTMRVMALAMRSAELGQTLVLGAG
jgi:predicted dehydrogenase